MPTARDVSRYDGLAQAFHWIIAALIVTQFVLAKLAARLPLGIEKLILLARHKSFGMTILVLMLLRLAWRLWHGAPPPAAGMTRLGRRAAGAMHATLYLLLFAMPVTGWMMSSAKNYSVSWFGVFTWPNLIGPGEAAFKTLRATHYLLSKLLLAVAILHILAALKHHFWDKDEVLRRMLPGKPTGGRV